MADITSNLVAWYKLDETSGTTAVDSSGSGYDGTYTNSPTLGVTGAFGTSTAVTFAAASSHYMTTGAASLGSTDLFADSDNFSVAAWVKASASVSGAIIAKAGSTSANRTFYLFFSGGALAVIIRGTQTNFSSNVLDGSWKHLVFTYDGTTAKMYWNGAYIGVVSVGTAAIESTENIMVGARTSGSPAFFLNASGTIDDVRIYSRALSADDVSTLYAYTGSVGPLVGPGRLTNFGGRLIRN